MVIKKIETRDYLRKLITRANKEAGVKFNSSKLNSKEECEEYILNLIKNLRHKPQNNKAYIKEIDELKEEIEILKKDNDNLTIKIKDRNFYFKLANEVVNDLSDERNRHFETKNRIKDYKKIIYSLLTISIIETISIFVLAWK